MTDMSSREADPQEALETAEARNVPVVIRDPRRPRYGKVLQRTPEVFPEGTAEWGVSINANGIGKVVARNEVRLKLQGAVKDNREVLVVNGAEDPVSALESVIDRPVADPEQP